MTHRLTARANDDLNVLLQRIQEAHQLFDREMIEPIVGERRHFGLGNAQDGR